jgi:hypothetical protein
MSGGFRGCCAAEVVNYLRKTLVVLLIENILSWKVPIKVT